MSTKPVWQILKEQNKAGVIPIDPMASVYQASLVLTEAKIGVLIVTIRGKLVGILSERDIVGRVVARNRDLHHTYVENIMTKDVITVTPQTNHDECNNLMRDNNIRHLPVIENGKAIAMVSISDLIKSDAYDNLLLAQHLEGYLTKNG